MLTKRRTLPFILPVCCDPFLSSTSSESIDAHYDNNDDNVNDKFLLITDGEVYDSGAAN